LKRQKLQPSENAPEKKKEIVEAMTASAEV
jgi:hypothetical protein